MNDRLDARMVVARTRRGWRGPFSADGAALGGAVSQPGARVAFSRVS
ncbi:MAG: hypothetical protein JOZ90_01825 [Alphaproteobacteria bacterium]|nr:hypothetical protein [Alphaproteobacteria bacterium]MBV9370743.1 hypothetical protein [Alphaproteobacteria bacterium]MBV9899816.1 hypothetical protein [Alphaproteobacteria bacterium]